MAFEDYWEFIALGIDLGLAALFYKLYRDKAKAAEQIRTVPVHSINSNLVRRVHENGELAYVCVEGCVAPTHQEDILTSRFGADVGVIRHTLHTEHKSKRESGYWRDVKHVIKDYYDSVGFVLRGEDATQLQVEEPLQAYCLQDDLRVTYDKFEKNDHSLLSRGIDRLFGDVTKGFQETERMLPVGTTLLGIGRLTVDDGNLTLDPPLQGQRYILTTLSRKQLIRTLESGAWYLRVCWWVCEGLGLGLVCWWLWRAVRKWWAKRRESRVYEEIRNQVAQLQDTDSAEDSSMCVICLVNRRSVVLLHCGHICVCVDCAEALPSPKKCPVCRTDVQRMVPTYIP